MFVVKDNGLTLGSKVATLKLHTEYPINLKYVTALYALSGGYNEVARDVDLEEYKKLQKKFNEVIQEMTALL